MLLLFSNAYAAEEATEGYDENTELTVRGTVGEVIRETRGPVIVILQSGSKRYSIITAPPWYLQQSGLELKTGTSYEVTGSKYIARDGILYVVASRLKNLSTGGITTLRDSSGMPLWKGHRMRRGADLGF